MASTMKETRRDHYVSDALDRLTRILGADRDLVYLVVAGAWMMFQKAGEAGWKAIIPIYNMYIVYKICWNTSLFWVWFGISVFAAVFGFQTETTTGFAYIIAMVLSLVQMLIQVTCCYRLSFAFGHGLLYGLGLCFFPFIFTVILAFGSSAYQPWRTNSLGF